MRELHLVLFKNRSCSSSTFCLEQAMEQQQFPWWKQEVLFCYKLCTTLQFWKGHHRTPCGQSVEQHPQCFLLQKAPTRLGSLRLLFGWTASKHLAQQLQFSLTAALRGSDFPHCSNKDSPKWPRQKPEVEELQIPES